MREYGPGVYDPLSETRNWTGLPYRGLTVSDVNDLLELTHQPYMYERQRKKIEKRFGKLCDNLGNDDLNRSNQQALSVLRFALQCIAALSENGSKEASKTVLFAERVGNIPVSKYYRGETRLEFFSGEEAATSMGGKCRRWLDYRVRVSESYKLTLWADFERMNASNAYTFCDCMIDACFIEEDGTVIQDVFNYKEDCYVLFRVGDVFGNKNNDEDDFMRCKALSGLVDYLGTLHLYEVELRIAGWAIAHQTNTLLAQAWRVAFEALSEVTLRDDKYGKRKLKYRVFCCADCDSPRIVKRGKNAMRCPLCSNNNTKVHKTSNRRVY